jgi:hypothetical protein
VFCGGFPEPKQLKRLGNSGRKLIAGISLGLGLAGPAGAGVATGLATMTAPREAKADLTIGGVTAREVELEVPLDILDSQSEPRRSGRVVGPIYNEERGRYTNSIRSNGHLFLVTLDSSQKSMTVARREGNRDVSVAGADLTGFADQVRELTGRELDGVDLGLRFVVTRGSFMYQGRSTRYTTIYLVPVDVQSEQFLSCASDNGPCLAFEVSQFADRVTGLPVWLRDPPPRGVAQGRP